MFQCGAPPCAASSLLSRLETMLLTSCTWKERCMASCLCATTCKGSTFSNLRVQERPDVRPEPQTQKGVLCTTHLATDVHRGQNLPPLQRLEIIDGHCRLLSPLYHSYMPLIGCDCEACDAFRLQRGLNELLLLGIEISDDNIVARGIHNRCVADDMQVVLDVVPQAPYMPAGKSTNV